MLQILWRGGGASQSTRFLLRFFNIPEGVNVVVHHALDCADENQDGDTLDSDDDE